MHVTIRRKVLELRGLHPREAVQHYFFATTSSPEFGPMSGPERSTLSNEYEPQWVRFDCVWSMNILPVELAEFLTGVALHGWPGQVATVERRV